MAKIWHFSEFFHFYPTLDYYKIRTRTDFENPNRKRLDLHLIMWFTLKQLFLGSTDFTEANFRIPLMSKHFSAMLPNAVPWLLSPLWPVGRKVRATMGTAFDLHKQCRLFWIITLHNVCEVHRGVCSITEDFSTLGGYHEYSGEYHEYTGGCSVHWGISWAHRGISR